MSRRTLGSHFTIYRPVDGCSLLAWRSKCSLLLTHPRRRPADPGELPNHSYQARSSLMMLGSYAPMPLR